ncbi:hypothetical protein BB559_000635 [Furculomyces boomerangus]|uniref:C2H2-type domain-containing protein n=1 Tax=Furculomyces boomerangus TaxID=61424 RepID=A0A2T9Z4I1_9FUNG|nr:hypothetical protein BB559_000635 [Furculomyces boomerangus]
MNASQNPFGLLFPFESEGNQIFFSGNQNNLELEGIEGNGVLGGIENQGFYNQQGQNGMYQNKTKQSQMNEQTGPTNQQNEQSFGLGSQNYKTPRNNGYDQNKKYQNTFLNDEFFSKGVMQSLTDIELNNNQANKQKNGNGIDNGLYNSEPNLMNNLNEIERVGTTDCNTLQQIGNNVYTDSSSSSSELTLDQIKKNLISRRFSENECQANYVIPGPSQQSDTLKSQNTTVQRYIEQHGEGIVSNGNSRSYVGYNMEQGDYYPPNHISSGFYQSAIQTKQKTLPDSIILGENGNLSLNNLLGNYTNGYGSNENFSQFELEKNYNFNNQTLQQNRNVPPTNGNDDGTKYPHMESPTNDNVNPLPLTHLQMSHIQNQQQQMYLSRNQIENEHLSTNHQHITNSDPNMFGSLVNLNDGNIPIQYYSSDGPIGTIMDSHAYNPYQNQYGMLQELPYFMNQYQNFGGMMSVSRPFKCPTCEQSFSRNHDLKRHIKIHTGIKPYKCKRCNKRFGRSDALKRHSLVKRCRMLEAANKEKAENKVKNAKVSINKNSSLGTGDNVNGPESKRMKTSFDFQTKTSVETTKNDTSREKPGLHSSSSSSDSTTTGGSLPSPSHSNPSNNTKDNGQITYPQKNVFEHGAKHNFGDPGIPELFVNNGIFKPDSLSINVKGINSMEKNNKQESDLLLDNLDPNNFFLDGEKLDLISQQSVQLLLSQFNNGSFETKNN